MMSPENLVPTSRTAAISRGALQKAIAEASGIRGTAHVSKAKVSYRLLRAGIIRSRCGRVTLISIRMAGVQGASGGQARAAEVVRAITSFADIAWDKRCWVL